MSEVESAQEELASAIGARLLALGWTVAVAESLTSGRLASRLGAAPDASEWFNGGVVAYAAEVKFKVLDVERGPVVTAKCAREMASGVARLLGADLGVSTTGVGGPDPDEGHPAGTVFIAITSVEGEPTVTEHHFDGPPAEVVQAATLEALKLLHATIS